MLTGKHQYANKRVPLEKRRWQWDEFWSSWNVMFHVMKYRKEKEMNKHPALPYCLLMSRRLWCKEASGPCPFTYDSFSIQRITMCPNGYHHNGFMATPALGTQEVRLHIVWTALWSHQSAQTVNSEQCIVQKVNVPRGGSSSNPRECSNCLGSGGNIQRITMCPDGYHHNGFKATPALGTQ